MFDPLALAAAGGLRVEFTDLGSWGEVMLVSEYDAAARSIRVNIRALEAYRRACGDCDEAGETALIRFAVAHELYHHHEAEGLVPRLPTRALREEAADRYAAGHVRIDPDIAAFLQTALA